MPGFFRSLIIFLSVILSPALIVFAQPAGQETNSSYADIEAAKLKYLSLNQFSEFIDFLNNYKDKSIPACLDYYKASTRYAQLKYLEEKQSWDDYFANGNTYRDELVENAQKVINRTDGANSFRLKSRLLLWQFHRDQLDAFSQQSLDDLVLDLNAYAKAGGDLDLIKEVADKFLAYGEKAKAHEAYKLYVEGLVAKKMDLPQLKSEAVKFYQEGNLDLVESLYDIYIDESAKIYSVKESIPELFEIAGFFVCKPTGLYDMAYAEKIYAKIEELGQKGVFNQDTIYLRAFNLEKMSAYQDARKYYLELIQDYPDDDHFDEAVYKVAMIDLYALADINEARKYFDLLAAKSDLSPQVISSLYQLGLLSQWQGDLAKAGSDYELLLNKAQHKYASTVALTKERISEIRENKPLDYNLRTFLDLSLKEGSTLVELNKSELKSSSYILAENQKNMITSLVNMPQSGCNQVELQYLWSGDLGGASPLVTESGFSQSYSDSGTKQINMVIISPAGTLDRSFIMVDVY